MGKIFICYRRKDSQDMAGRLYDRLAAKFGSGNVFIDIDSLPAAEEFPAKVQATVAQCDVFLALIGEHWLDARDDDGKRRLDDAHDYVRQEIEEALRQGVKTLPVLLHQASMPSRKALPPTCGRLAEITALPIRHADFKLDVERLLATVAAMLAERKRQRAEEQARLAREQAERQRHAREQSRREQQERRGAQPRDLGRAPPRARYTRVLAAVAFAIVAIAVSFSLLNRGGKSGSPLGSQLPGVTTYTVPASLVPPAPMGGPGSPPVPAPVPPSPADDSQPRPAAPPAPMAANRSSGVTGYATDRIAGTPPADSSDKMPYAHS